MAATPVSIIKTERVVYPKTTLNNPPKLITLSSLDRQCPTHMYLVLFYKHHPATADHDQDDVVSVYGRLKSGLERTLEAWYPAAGRLCLDADDGNKKLNLWCNNEGAVLVEAVTEKKISELGDDLSQYDEFFERLVYKPVFDVDRLSEMPLLVAQVTRFGCGGYSIGIGTSHSLFDGLSTFHFLSAWASASSTSSSSEPKIASTSTTIVDHDRGSLTSLGHNNNDVVKGTTAVSPSAGAIDHLYRLIHQQATAAAATSDDQKKPEYSSKCVLKTYHVSSAMIDNLRRNIFGGSGDDYAACSSFEIVAAHLWKARTKALLLTTANKPTTTVCLQFAVDIRNKLSPPLPAGFTGNAFVLASIALTSGELQQSTHQSIIDRIRAAKSSVTPAYVESYMASLDRQHGNSNSSTTSQLPPLNELTLVSDWTRTPFHKLRFLGGDRDVDYACPLLSPVPQVAYFMQSPLDSKGIDVRIGLLDSALEGFTADFLDAMV